MDADFVVLLQKLVVIENSWSGTVLREIPVGYRIHGRDLVAQIDTPNIAWENSGYHLTKDIFVKLFRIDGGRKAICLCRTAAARLSRMTRETRTPDPHPDRLSRFTEAISGLTCQTHPRLHQYSVFRVFGTAGPQGLESSRAATRWAA